MNIQQILTANTARLLDTEIALAYVLKKDRSFIKAHDDYVLTPSEQQLLDSILAQLKADVPLAYILSTKEFYGHNFFVSSDVLIPRPCTENLVDAVISYDSTTSKDEIRPIDTQIVCWQKVLTNTKPQVLIEVGTGSGAIAVSIAHEIRTPIIATDISSEALDVAKQNAVSHKTSEQITLVQEECFETVQTVKKPFLLVSNPPYIPSNQVIQNSVFKSEPHLALFAGKEGIDVLVPLLRAAKSNPFCTGWIVECQAEQPAKILTQLDLHDD